MGDQRKDVLKSSMAKGILAAWDGYKSKQKTTRKPGPEWFGCEELAKVAGISRGSMYKRLRIMLDNGQVEHKTGWPADWWRLKA